MVEEAKENEANDKKRKEDADTRNQAETLINQIDDEVNKAGDKLQPAQKESILKIRNDIKTALDKNDLDTVRQRIAELQQAAYQAQQFAGQNAAGATPEQNTAGSTEAKNNNSDTDGHVYDAKPGDNNGNK